MAWVFRWFLIVPLMVILGALIIICGAVSFGLQTLFRVGSNERLDFYS